MKNYIIRYASLALAILGVVACSEEHETAPSQDAKSTPMSFVVTHPGQTRATATAFERDDRIGLYVADVNAPLELGGNLVNNEALTFDGNKWAASRTLFWDKGSFNAYAYYPYIKGISSITDQPFSVSTDQSTAKTATVSTTGSTDDESKLKIRLIKGEDFEGDMPTTATVYIHNTVPTATVDLQAGVATRYVKGKRQTIIARQDGDTSYSAIIVPQRIDNRQPLIEVVMNGVSYLFESKFQFKPGTEHLVNLIISDNPDKVKIDIGGEIQDWQ